MPVILDQAHPSYASLSKTQPYLIASHFATIPDRRIGILNLMPTKIETEHQLIKKLGTSPLHISIEWIRPESHVCTHTDPNHIHQFYKTIPQIIHKSFDGIIITGAPVELLDFSEVDYWPEFRDFLAWCTRSTSSTLHLCWAAQAGLYQRYGIEKQELQKKLFGVFSHENLKPHSPIMNGFDPIFRAPHSRHTQISIEDVARVSSLSILATSDRAGIYLIESEDSKEIYVTGHPEYASETLVKEYERDLQLHDKSVSRF